MACKNIRLSALQARTRRDEITVTHKTGAYSEIWYGAEHQDGDGPEEPFYGRTYMPRKFKIGFAIPPSNDIDAPGPLALTYILEAGGSGYFRQRVVAPHVAAGKLHLVAGAPSFFHPVYAVCSAHAEDELIALALGGLRSTAAGGQVEWKTT